MVAAVACAAVVATAATPVVFGAGSGSSSSGDEAAQRAASRAWSPFLGADRAVDVVDTRRVIVRFDDPSLGDWVAAKGTSKLGAAQRTAWLKKASDLQQRRLDALALAGIRFQVEHRYLKVLNGASIVVHGDSAQLLRDMSGVASITPVRTLWPTAVEAGDDGSAGAAAAVGAASGDAGPSGAPVTVAVLDTGIDAKHPAVAGHVLRPLDATAPSVHATAAAKRAAVAAGSTIAADPHGTAVAGAVLAGAGRGANVRLQPVQVLSSRPDRDGVEQVLGSSDDLLWGLEQVVDPDGTVGTNDAIDIAVIASTSPYAGFAGSPEDAAVHAASALGTLVVAAAGNDGASGDDVGTVGSVAASRDALTVGATDLRRTVPAADVRVHGDGVDETFDAATLVTADGSKLPRGDHAVVVVEGHGDEVVDYLDEQLRSRVQGAVALVATRDGVSAAAQVRAAADAGAIAVLVASDDADGAAGTIDERGSDIPAIAIQKSDARALRDALADGKALAVSMRATTTSNDAFGSVAGFSSTGPRLDGYGRPDAVAPGVGMLVAGQGTSWHHASGTSIAAAWAAGQAAAAHAANPKLSPAELRAVLMGSSILLGSDRNRPAVSLQGAGVLDVEHASSADWYVAGGRVDFGSVAPGATARQTIDLRSITGAERPDSLRILVDDGGHGSSVTPTLDGDDLVLDVPADAAEGHVGGWLLLPDQELKVPWSVTVRDAATQTVPIRATLSQRTLKPVAGPGAYAGSLELAIGGRDAGDALGLAAVEKLELRLIGSDGKPHGVLGGLNQALPGVYTFGITGVDARGERLKPGAWQLQVRYVPASDPDGAWRTGPTATFAIAGQSRAKAAATRQK